MEKINSLKVMANNAIHYRNGVPFRGGIVVGLFTLAAVTAGIFNKAHSNQQAPSKPSECRILLGNDRSIPCEYAPRYMPAN